MNNTMEELKNFYSEALKNQQSGNYSVAKSLYKKILLKKPDHINTQNNLAVIYFQTSESTKAMELFEKVLHIEPNNMMAIENLGMVYNDLGEYEKAIACHERQIKIDPNHSVAHNNLGTVYKLMGKFEIAKDCYKKAINLKPNFEAAHNNLGVLLGTLKEDEKALGHFKKALESDSNYIKAQINIANIHIKNLDIENAISASKKSLEMHYQNIKTLNEQIPLFRFKHDYQQAKYLKSKNYKIDGIDEFIKVGKEVLEREYKNDNIDFKKKVLLSKNEIHSILNYSKAEHVYNAPLISGGALNQDKKWHEVENEYISSSKKIIYIDNFLSKKAIVELREFCMISKVWTTQYPNNYLGAFDDKGFISSLHLQIAIDLQKKMPNLFGKYNLRKFWGFKYDTSLGGGIGIHADFARLNLNFWITPDEYNNNKDGSGLKVYDIPAPDDWSFAKYNNNTKEIYKFLSSRNAKCKIIPYKFNRAVLFNSAYFHETDKIDFKEGYEGRRINMTYLFGDRAS